MDLSDIIRSIRKKNGLSQKDFAEKIGASQSAVNYWENGKRQPRLDQLEKIADAFNLDVWKLYEYYIINDGPPPIDGLSEGENDLINDYQKLNEVGKGKVIEYINMLTKLPEYQRPCDIAPLSAFARNENDTDTSDWE